MSVDYGFEIRPARYAKNMIAVHCESNGWGTKTRAARLISSHLKARWSNREKAYITTPAKGEKLRTLFAAGKDACVMTGNLYDPSEEDSGA